MSRYRLQRNGQWESHEGRVVDVTDEVVTVEDAEGIATDIPLAQVQGWATPGDAGDVAPEEG